MRPNAEPKESKLVLGDAAFDFLTDFWVNSAKPRIPRAEDFAELFGPYVALIEAQAKERAILFTLSEEAQRRGRSLMLRDYLKEIQGDKQQAMNRIAEDRLKRRFARPQLPTGE